jgi:NAD(P)-dependent dehydrogenase (short-subunit alcohol dehydrogenase family)
MSYFQGKKVFLVGGSEGIGRETAVALARAGADVVVAARRQGPLDETVAAMKAAGKDGQRLSALTLDATDREAVRASVPTVLDRLGGLDVLITNLGAARPGYVHELDDAAFDSMIQLNYLAHANVVRAFLPKFLEQKRGDICFVSSALGFMSMPGYSAYSASKFAVAGFAEALRIELATSNIKVVLFYPGTTDTPGLKTENSSKPAAVWKMESDSAFSKTHQPADVAKQMLRAIERGRFENFPGVDVWFIWWMYQHFPGLARWMAQREWAAAQAKAASAAPSAK